MNPHLSLHYRWTSGTIPPPYYYEYTIELDGLAGTLDFTADYSQHQPPVWRETFTCSPETAENLYKIMRKCHVFRKRWAQPKQLMVGGPQHFLKITRAGQVFPIPFHLTHLNQAALTPLFEAIRALVPQPIWDDLMARRETQIQEC
jgi:hypothetical protein